MPPCLSACLHIGTCWTIKNYLETSSGSSSNEGLCLVLKYTTGFLYQILLLYIVTLELLAQILADSYLFMVGSFCQIKLDLYKQVFIH